MACRARRILASQLGYAWRKAKKDFYNQASEDDAAQVIADLHAEALARLGSQMRPLDAGPLKVQIARGHPDFQDALAHLGLLAGGGGEGCRPAEQTVQDPTAAKATSASICFCGAHVWPQPQRAHEPQEPHHDESHERREGHE